MAADQYGIYLVYQTQGLFALDKNTFTQTGYYKTGLEFSPDNLWGQQELLCNNNYIYLTEYFGQTSILSNNPAFVATQNAENKITENCIKVFPNPSDNTKKIILDYTLCSENLKVARLNLFDNAGRKISMFWSNERQRINFLSDLKAGIYFYEIIFSDGSVGKGKFIVV